MRLRLSPLFFIANLNSVFCRPQNSNGDLLPLCENNKGYRFVFFYLLKNLYQTYVFVPKMLRVVQDV